MSEQPHRARLSRLDPTNWPTGTGTLLFIAWIAYAVASMVWVHPLIWTVLPIGLTLYLIAERYPWRVVLIFVVPLTLLTGISQVVVTWSEAPTTVAFVIYLVASAYFSVIVCSPERDRWIERLPGRILGEGFAARLAWTRFEESLMAANTLVRQIDASVDQEGRQGAMHRLAVDARREARRGGLWQEAWTAKAEWLEGVGALAGVEPSADQARHVHDLLLELDRSHMLAVERMGVLDPAST